MRMLSGMKPSFRRYNNCVWIEYADLNHSYASLCRRQTFAAESARFANAQVGGCDAYR
jgi:hypothetical protein